jgi:hypothetical protein
MKKILLIAAACLSMISPVCSANKVYVLGNNGHGIVADDTEWACEKIKKNGYDDKINCSSKHFPISCSFFFERISTPSTYPTPIDAYAELARKYALNFFSKYAQQNSSIVGDFHAQKERSKDFHEFDCSYFGNSSFGHMRLYVHHSRGSADSYCMLITIQGDFLDETMRNYMYEKAIPLITPLMSWR